MPNHKIKLQPIFRTKEVDDIHLFSESSIPYILLIGNFVYERHFNPSQNLFVTDISPWGFPFQNKSNFK